MPPPPHSRNRKPHTGDVVLLYGGRWTVVEVGEGGKRLMLRHTEDVEEEPRAWLDLAAWQDLREAMGDDEGGE